MTAPWLQKLHNNANTSPGISLELIEKYRSDCYSILDTLTITRIDQIEGDETNPLHLLWMLNEIQHNDEQSLTKKHRWLGYIQGVLIMKGVSTVQEEREFSRTILNGS